MQIVSIIPPTGVFKERTFNSCGLPPEGTLISASNVFTHCRVVEGREQRKLNEQGRQN